MKSEHVIQRLAFEAKTAWRDLIKEGAIIIEFDYAILSSHLFTIHNTE